VPRASLVILSGTLTAFGLPLAGITVILAVDELMDMGRTMVNLIGNCLATCVMARWEGEFTPGSSGRHRRDRTRWWRRSWGLGEGGAARSAL
jgi:proton glutamate symport protein